jgi:predicted small metal-binding protein
MTEYSADMKQVCGCNMAATGATQDEVVSKAKAHAMQAHGMKEVPAEIAQKLEAAIRRAV